MLAIVTFYMLGKAFEKLLSFILKHSAYFFKRVSTALNTCIFEDVQEIRRYLQLVWLWL